MILDAHALFSDNQTLIGSDNAEVYSTNVLDFAVPGIAAGAPLQIVITITTAVDSAGDASQLTFFVFSDATTTPTAEIVRSAVIEEATMVAGYQVALTVVPTTTLRYMRLRYDIDGEDITAGAFTAGVILDNQAGETAV